MKPGSKRWKKFMAKLYGIGAAVVILGALFKIEHFKGASLMLMVGLGTEAVIFFFSAFEPIHEEPDWSLVYPELATGEHAEGDDFSKVEDKGSITEQLDNMLEDAKIEPELIQSLGTGLRSLSDQAGSLNSMADASVATNDYVENLKSASSTVGDLSDSYAKASESLLGLSENQEAGKSAGENLQRMSQNLSQLNEMYEMQLRGSSEKLEAANQMFEGVNDLMSNLHSSVEDTKRYKENISELSEKLAKLNTVYGNMLNAMNLNQGTQA